MLRQLRSLALFCRLSGWRNNAKTSEYRDSLDKKKMIAITTQKYVKEIDKKIIEKQIQNLKGQLKQMFRRLLEIGTYIQDQQDFEQTKQWLKNFQSLAQNDLKTKYNCCLLAVVLSVSGNTLFARYKTAQVTTCLGIFGIKPTEQSYWPSQAENIRKKKSENDKIISSNHSQRSSKEPTMITNGQYKPDQSNFFDPSRQQAQLSQPLITKMAIQFDTLISLEKIKSKKGKLKQRFIIFILETIDNVKSKNGIILIIKLLVSLSNEMLQIDRVRMSKIAIKLAKKFDPYIHQNKQKISLMLLVNLISFFGSVRYECSLEIQQFCLQTLFSPQGIRPSSEQYFIRNFMAIYRFFPQTVVTLNQNGDITTNRIKLHEWFLGTLINENEAVRLAFINYEPSYIETFCIYIAESVFYKEYLQLKTQNIDGFLVITQSPQVPHIPQQILVRYEELRSHFELRNRVFHDLYTQFYSKRHQQNMQAIILENHKLSIELQASKYEKSSDNEAVARLCASIKLLGLQFSREKKIGSKMADFVVVHNKQKIIIECDGDVHFSFWSQEILPSTAYRNMIFMLNGYKIITVSSIQQNQNRTTEEIKQLLERKLRILQTEGIYYV